MCVCAHVCVCARARVCVHVQGHKCVCVRACVCVRHKDTARPRVRRRTRARRSDGARTNPPAVCAAMPPCADARLPLAASPVGCGCADAPAGWQSRCGRAGANEHACCAPGGTAHSPLVLSSDSGPAVRGGIVSPIFEKTCSVASRSEWPRVQGKAEDGVGHWQGTAGHVSQSPSGTSCAVQCGAALRCAALRFPCRCEYECSRLCAIDLKERTAAWRLCMQTTP